MRAASDTIWLKAGKMKSANWISATGRSPLTAAPMAAPAMSDSLRGVSKTRSSPNSAWSPSVTRNTPPFLPTSSPKIRVRGSSASDRLRASFSAFTMVTSATAAPAIELLRREPPGVLPLALQVGREVRVDPFEQLANGPGGRPDHARPHPRGEGLRLALDVVEERVVGAARGPQPAAVPLERIQTPPPLDLLGRAVLRRVIGRRVGADAVGDRLDQRGDAVVAGPGGGLLRGRVHRQHVVPVHLNPREPVGHGLAPDRRDRLGGQRHGDGPLVVLAEEDRGRPEHGGEVAPLVEVALGRRAVAEVDQ